MVREYSYKEIQLIGLQPHGKTQQWFQDDLSFGQQNPVKALGTCAWVAQHSSRERRGRRSGCWSIRKGLHCPGGSSKASSQSFSKKVTCCKRDLNNCGKTGEGCLARMTTFWFWSYSSCMRNCAIWGKNLWTYNIENHLVSAHSCQQMRNSFLLVSWEELPQQALQQCRVWLATDTALALQGQDMINFPMKKKTPAEFHRKSRKRSGAWELNGCSRSGPFSWQAQKMKGAQENSVLLLTEKWIKANKRRQNSIKTCASACIIIVLSYLMLCQNPLSLSPGASHR